MEFTQLNPVERKRTYHFPVGKVEIENVSAVCVRPSGNHRLQTEDGGKYIVNSGWNCIEIDTDKWTF